TVRAVLQTLTDPDVPVLTVGFDTDCCGDTGAPTLPDVVWPADRPLGLEYALVASSRGATLLRDDNGAWSKVAEVDCTVDPAMQTITATVPRALLDPGDDQWRVFASAGLADGGIYDLAFVCDASPARPRGASNAWQDRDQADILAGRLSSDL